MKKRIGMVGAVCLLVLGVFAGSRCNTFAPEGQVNDTDVVLMQVSSAKPEIGSAINIDHSECAEEECVVETEEISDVENVPETELNEDENTEAQIDTVSENEAETQAEEGTNQETDIVGNYAIADVNDYVNVRSKPSTDGAVVGKIYDDSVAEIVAVTGEEGDWFQITSRNVEGYIKAEFFIYGKEAEEVLDQYISSFVKIKADRLNVRKEKSINSESIGRLNNGDKVELLEDCGEWVKIQYGTQKSGYVSAEYVEIAEEYSYAKTLEEDRAERANNQENGQRIVAMTGVFPATSYATNVELRQSIVAYALQFVGGKYRNGGSSLTEGTDCSGFTCFIYRDFGYSISRTPGGQFSSAGRSIDYSEIQSGDIICYSSNGGKSCTHVALYIGDGQIVHAANSRKGIIVERADYDTIIGIRNVID